MELALPAAAPARLLLEEKLLLGAIAIFVAMKLAFSLFAFPVVDEGYYWMWGQHPALSYFDHPPLQAWLQGLSHAILGRSTFALRWMTWAALAVELWIFYDVARRLAGDAWRVVFLRSTAVFLASPLFGFFGTLAFHDYLLVALVMASGYLFIRFFTDVEEGKRGQNLELFGAAALLGLATLTKYNGAFLGIGVALAVLVRPNLWRLLLDWRLYTAALLAVALQVPVVMWNFENGYASLLYQFGSRHGETVGGKFDIGAIKAAAGEQLLIVSAFLIPTIIRFFWATQHNPFERVGKTVAICVFWVSTLICLYVASYSFVMFWWNILAFVLIFPFAGRYVRPVLLAVHIGYGLYVNAFLLLTYSVVPPLLLMGISLNMDTERNHGWPAIVEQVAAARVTHNADFIATNTAHSSAQIGWALDDPSIVTLSSERTTYTDWHDPAPLAGKSAVVLEHPRGDLGWRDSFATITEIGEVPAKALWFTLMTYRLYFAQGFGETP